MNRPRRNSQLNDPIDLETQRARRNRPRLLQSTKAQSGQVSSELITDRASPGLNLQDLLTGNSVEAPLHDSDENDIRQPPL